ncbi:MAG: hypothetical protein JW958_11185 [Candidatus Eisenbacteria bacterium]|nr:hypothetical protein [Candidatus Eisenbacteria bacterium]
MRKNPCGSWRIFPSIYARYALVFVGMLAGASSARAAEITLRWTAPAENGATGGPAAFYEMRYHSASVGGDTAAWWNGADEVAGLPAPSLPGSEDSVVLGGLEPGETYWFVVRSGDEAENLSGFSAPLAVGVPDSTPPAEPPTILAVAVDYWMTDSVSVHWETDRPATGMLRYGPDASYGSTVTAPQPAWEQTVRLDGFAEGETVHFQIVAMDGAARDSTADSSFVAPDPAPVRPSGVISYSAEYATSLLWMPNLESDLDGYRVFRTSLARSAAPVLLECDFDGGTAGEDPAGFTETDSSGVPTDLFRLAEAPGRGLALRGNASGGEARLLLDGGYEWTDWEATGSVRFAEGAGANLFLRASGGAAYRIGLSPGGALRAVGEGSASPEESGGALLPPDPDVWYRFRALAWERNGAVRLEAALWPEGSDEPARFPLRAFDDGPGRPAAGTFGFGVSGTGEVWFDDVTVHMLPDETTVETTTFNFLTQDGLDADSSYHYWVLAMDDAGSASAPAGPVTAYPTAPEPEDTVAPDPVVDLVASPGPEEDQAILRWTAPGDDGEVGTASSYDVRWAADTLHEGNWESATALAAGAPAAPGSAESLLVGGLPAGTVCRFAMEALDEVGNRSGLSNTAGCVTPGDTTAPVLADIRVEEASFASARIGWDLNEPGDGRVEYGRTTSYEIGSEGEEARVLHHHITIGGLDPTTLYHYRVRSTDVSGNEAVSGDRTFTTEAAPPPAAPVISGVTVDVVSDTDAVIAFETDIPAFGAVDFGLTAAYGEAVQEESSGAAHRIRLHPLSHGMVYHFRVRAVSAGGETIDADRTFQTASEDDPPIVSGVVVTVTDSSARIVWNTNEETACFVEHGPTAAYGDSTPLSETYLLSHEASLTGLPPATTRHFRIRAEDHHGNAALTEDAMFVTAEGPDETPPVVADLRVEEITFRGAAVLWSTDEPAFGEVRYGTDSSCAGGFAETAGAALDHRIELSDLAAGTTHFLRVRAWDESGNEAVSEVLSFPTDEAPDTTAPAISGIGIADVEESGVTVFWRTDEPTRGALFFGVLSAGEDSLEEEEPAVDHEIRLDGLVPGGVYRYRIVASDGAGNRSESEERSFALDAPDTIPPAVIDLTALEDGEGAVLFVWTSDEPARGRVEYGPDQEYGSATTMEESLALDHQARIHGLDPGTAIHYRVVQEDGAGNRVRSEDGVFLLPEEDGTAPSFLEVEVLAVGRTDAIVAWKTDEPTCGRVLFGRTEACGDSTPVDSTVSDKHEIFLDGLSPLTLYHYRVCCTDTAGNASLSTVGTFTTEGHVDTIPPRFGNIELTDLGEGKASVRWQTDEPSACSVEYGPDTTLGASIAKMDVFGFFHRFDVEGLETGRFYYFRAAARDTAGNEALSELLSVYMEESADTSETNPAVDVRVETGIRDAVVIWETGGPTDGRVDYGTDPGCSEWVHDPSFTIAHRIALEGLQPSTFYYYRISGEDAEGHALELGGLSFRTRPDTLPEVSGMATVPEEGLVRFFWSLDRLAVGRVEIGSDTLSLAAATEEDFLFTYDHADTVSGLAPDRVFYWRVRGTTLAGVDFLTRIDSFRTASDVTPPPPPARLSGERTDGGVRLAWENGEGERPDSLILHRRLLPGGEWMVVWITTSGVTEHVDPLSRAERVSYDKAEYRLEAVDAYGNRCTGETFAVEIAVPAEIVLLPNRPNPFNPTTTIGFELPPAGGAALPVRLAVYNVRGEEVRLLLDETLPTDRRHEVVWDGSDYRGNPVASGSYFYRLTAPSYAETRRMVLIR